MRAWIGIDVGASGAIAVLKENHIPETLRFTSSTDKQVCDFLNKIISTYDCMCVVEQVGAMPGQGVTSMFSFGQSAGFIRGVITALGLSFEQKVPRVWQKALGISPRLIERDAAKKIINEESKTDFKRRLRQKAEQLFPDIKFTNDIADAVLIAEYCRREHGGYKQTIVTDFNLPHTQEQIEKTNDLFIQKAQQVLDVLHTFNDEEF